MFISIYINTKPTIIENIGAGSSIRVIEKMLIHK